MDKKEILKRHGKRCFYCGEPLTKETMTRDHFIPKSLGGDDTPENIVPSCGECNHRKANHILTEHLLGRFCHNAKFRRYPIQIRAFLGCAYETR